MVFDVGGTAIKYGMVNENFEFIFSDEMPTNAFYGGNGVMNSLEAKLDEFAGQFDAIGVSTAGQIDFATGEVIGGTGNIPIQRALKEIGFENVLVVKEEEMQISMFMPFMENPVVDKLKALNLMEVTPSQAIRILEELKESIDD